MLQRLQDGIILLKEKLMLKSKKQKAVTSSFISLTLSYVLWGINTPVIKLGLQTVPLAIFLSVTILSAAFLTLPFAVKSWKPLKRRDHALLIIGAMIAIPLGNVVLLMGVQRIPAVNATLLGLLSPLLLFILSVEFLKERMSLRTFIGILIAFLGAALVIGKPWQASASNPDQLIGSLLVVLAVLCDVVATLIYKQVSKRVGSYQLVFTQLFWGGIPVALFATKYFFDQSAVHIGRDSVLVMIANITLITLANCLFMYGLKQRKAQDVAIFQYIHPVVTAIAAWFILVEAPSLKLIPGAALIFIGIYLAEVHTSQKHHIAWKRH